jgi:hypothetical protein
MLLTWAKENWQAQISLCFSLVLKNFFLKQPRSHHQYLIRIRHKGAAKSIDVRTSVAEEAIVSVLTNGRQDLHFMGLLPQSLSTACSQRFKTKESVMERGSRIATIPFYKVEEGLPVDNSGGDPEVDAPDADVEIDRNDVNAEVRMSARQAVTCWLGRFVEAFPAYQINVVGGLTVTRVGNHKFELHNLSLCMSRCDGGPLGVKDVEMLDNAPLLLCDYLCAWFRTEPEQRTAIELLNCDCYLA